MSKVKVKIIPKNARVKNRVREHGEIMTLVREGENTQCFPNEKSILVESLNGKWLGWLGESETEWEIL
jgi:hypothetical protein